MSGGCWIWQGAKSHGYGMFEFLGKSRHAHRVAWALLYGELPAVGIEVCHACDTPLCVRPLHLFLGTHAENLRDAQAKGRLATHANGRWRFKGQGRPRRR